MRPLRQRRLLCYRSRDQSLLRPTSTGRHQRRIFLVRRRKLRLRWRRRLHPYKRRWERPPLRCREAAHFRLHSLRLLRPHKAREVHSLLRLRSRRHQRRTLHPRDCSRRRCGRSRPNWERPSLQPLRCSFPLSPRPNFQALAWALRSRHSVRPLPALGVGGPLELRPVRRGLRGRRRTQLRVLSAPLPEGSRARSLWPPLRVVRFRGRGKQGWPPLDPRLRHFKRSGEHRRGSMRRPLDSEGRRSWACRMRGHPLAPGRRVQGRQQGGRAQGRRQRGRPLVGHPLVAPPRRGHPSVGRPLRGPLLVGHSTAGHLTAGHRPPSVELRSLTISARPRPWHGRRRRLLLSAARRARRNRCSSTARGRPPPRVSPAS